MGEIGEHFRDLKEYRKQQKEKNPPRKRCWDWMVVSGSAHYAKNRSSFKTYRRINPNIKKGIIGIGSVELEVRRSPKKGSGTSVVLLKNVLHMPDAPCNGFQFCMWMGTVPGSTVAFTQDGVQASMMKIGEKLWHAKEFSGLNRLVIANNPQGESQLSALRDAALALYLSEEESTALFAEAPSEEEKVDGPVTRCWDWMVIMGDCHYARDRSSFKTYRKIDGIEGGIVGIGSVELRVRRSPRKGSGTTRLLLGEVLHVPGAYCNGFNVKLELQRSESTVAMTKDLTQASAKGTGRKLWYGESSFKGLTRLAIAKNPKGESPLSNLPPDTELSLSWFLSDEQRISLAEHMKL